MVTREQVLDVLRTIDDPEMPISIVDLGIVNKVDVQPEFDDARATHKQARVSIEILPTFVGCPALPVIESEIRRRLTELPHVAAVDVATTYAPPWTVDRISAIGRESLRRHGVTVPQPDGENASPDCPFCGSSKVHEDSAFGPTRCRMIWYCEACRQPFEHLKRLATAGLVELSTDRLEGP